MIFAFISTRARPSKSLHVEEGTGGTLELFAVNTLVASKPVPAAYCEWVPDRRSAGHLRVKSPENPSASEVELV